MRILICSENVPPQVNGIARRIGHYESGLRELGHDVHVVHPTSTCSWPYMNPWNSTAKMMLLHPSYVWQLLVDKERKYDVVHCVLPLNLSGMWLLVAFQLLRTLDWSQRQPALVVSWHCNILSYVEHYVPPVLYDLIGSAWTFSIVSLLPNISDRILAPTTTTDPSVMRMWSPDRRGICETGMDLRSFHPSHRNSRWGQLWLKRRQSFLKKTNCKYLLLYVGRLSNEKSVPDLIEALALLKTDCALFVVGDGPIRQTLESKARGLPVYFWGYQQKEALYAVYTAADLLVCPSRSETFGQIANEALASHLRVALPRVPVFVEAYGRHIPKDAFWKPGVRESMVRAIKLQLQRHDRNDPVGRPDRSKLMSWEDACHGLVSEYEEARNNIKAGLPLFYVLFLPIWFSATTFCAVVMYLLSTVRTWSLKGQSMIRSQLATAEWTLYHALKQTHQHGAKLSDQ